MQDTIIGLSREKRNCTVVFSTRQQQTSIKKHKKKDVDNNNNETKQNKTVGSFIQTAVAVPPFYKYKKILYFQGISQRTTIERQDILK